jgi:hypothetical protein
MIALFAATTLLGGVGIVPATMVAADAAPKTSKNRTTGGGNADCPTGTTELAKFNVKDDGTYVAESGGDIISVFNTTADGGDFKVKIAGYTVSAVVVKGGTDAKITKFDPPVTAGSFDNTGLVNNGGQVPAISNVKFCGSYTPPPPCESKGMSNYKFDCTSITPLDPKDVKPTDAKTRYKLNGQVVTTPNGTAIQVTPGTYTLTLEVWNKKKEKWEEVDKDVIEVPDCPKPKLAVTGSVDCNGFVVKLDNSKGAAEATATVTKPDGTTEIVKVPAGQTASRTYPVIEDKTATVTVKSEGMQDFTLSYTADCVKTPPPPPPTTPTPVPPYTCPPGTAWTDTDHDGVMEPGECVETSSTQQTRKFKAVLKSNCLTARLGEFSVFVKNLKVSTVPIAVKIKVNGKVDQRKLLRPGKSYGATAIVGVGTRVKLFVDGKVVRKTRVPTGCGNSTPNPGGLKTQASAGG